MTDANRDIQEEGLSADEEAHKYFMHPEKPEKLLCIPVQDVDISDMDCFFAQFLPENGEHDLWNVTFPDLPGCLTCGSGLKQAFANAMDALAGYLSIAKSKNLEIPEPSDMETAIAKARKENADIDIKPDAAPLYLLIPAWTAI